MITIVAGALLCLCGLLLLLLGVHPFTTYPLSLRLLAARQAKKQVTRRGGDVPSAALCVCAYNEEDVIEAKIENMLAMRLAIPQLEILVYVDGATDRTAAILRRHAGELRLEVSPVRHGKTHGMNVLVGLTNAETIVFSDANVMFAPDAVPRLLAPFTDPAVGAVCGHLVYVNARSSTAEISSRYWRLEERIKTLESDTGSVMGADGSIFAIRRALHHPPPPDLIDDMYVSLSVLCDGSRIVRAGDALAYEEAASRPAEEFRRKIRISCQAFNVHRALRPRLRALAALDRYKYVSHKLLRWMTMYFLVAGGAAVLGGIALAASWVGAATLGVAGLIALAAVMLVPRGPLAALRDVLAAFLATGIGVALSMRGQRFQTWSPPSSGRGGRPGVAPDRTLAGVSAQR